MDEPFGAVDEITRAQLQTELKQIYEKTGITVLFVTHDISEALKLGRATGLGVKELSEMLSLLDDSDN